METPESITGAIQSGAITQPILLTGPATINWDDLGAQIQHSLGNAVESIILVPDGHSIKIKEVRGLLEQLSTTAFTKERLVWISPIDRIEIPAANALLKELEESSSQNQFILATSFPGRVLPTIVSRCQTRRLAHAGDTAGTHDWKETVRSLLTSSKKDALTDDELQAIEMYLLSATKQGDTTPQLLASMMRLRDFYKIRAHRGNQKLATEVLLATLSQMRNTAN